VNHDDRTHNEAITPTYHGPAPTKRDDADLDQLAEEFSKAIRQGHSPDIKEYASRYPEDADQIRELL
jgi:hypothetical protein